jgi:dolichyl-diphosphooligosaccharide---protein glycosyltransferase
LVFIVNVGVFGLVQIVAFTEMVKSLVSEKEFKALFQGLILSIAVIGTGAIVSLTYAGYIAPFTGRFYSLWDTGYAKIHIPIIASVSEHQPTAWPSFFFDLQLLICVFPAGVYLCFRKMKDEHVFVILYAATASYFAGVMVRLMLTLTPIVCVTAAIAFTSLLETYVQPSTQIETLETLEPVPTPLKKTSKSEKSGKEERKSEKKKSETTLGNFQLAITFPVALVLCMFGWHCTFVTSTAYSSPSVVLATTARDGSQHIIDDFREAYYWLRQNVFIFDLDRRKIKNIVLVGLWLPNHWILKSNSDG